MPRLKKPKNLVFTCDSCGAVHNYLPPMCKQCGSFKLEEKEIKSHRIS